MKYLQLKGVQSTALSLFVMDCNQCLKEGWKLHGGMILSPSSIGHTYVQIFEKECESQSVDITIMSDSKPVFADEVKQVKATARPAPNCDFGVL